jgi:hypothetical protein
VTKPAIAALSALLLAAPAAAQPRAAPTPAPPASSAHHRLVQPGGADIYAVPGPMSARVPVSGDLDLGVGMFSVTGHFVRDRGSRGREPMIGTAGRQNKVAAVGLSLRF